MPSAGDAGHAVSEKGRLSLLMAMALMAVVAWGLTAQGCMGRTGMGWSWWGAGAGGGLALSLTGIGARGPDAQAGQVPIPPNLRRGINNGICMGHKRSRSKSH